MAEFLSPGVYVIEEASGLKPIEGVSTSTGGFIGLAEKGPVDTPRLITSFTQFKKEFGENVSSSFLATSVYQFFKEGGARCYVVRTVSHDDAGVPESTPASSPAVAALGEAVFQAASDGAWGVTVIENDADFSSGLRYEKGVQLKISNATESQGKLKVVVYYGKDQKAIKINRMKSAGAKMDVQAVAEIWDEIPPEDLEETLSLSDYVRLATAPTELSLPLAADIVVNLTSGGSDATSALNKVDLIGSEDTGIGFHAFDTIDAVNIIACPDATLLPGDVGEIMREGMIYCESRGDCFFIAHGTDSLDVSGIQNFKSTSMLSSSFGALYYPWLYSTNPFTGDSGYVPPCGAITGIIANTDIKVGVHKAPAGHATGKVLSATGVKNQVSKGEHDVLNPDGINVIRSFPNSGLIVWGARTVSADSEWKYINVRRLFLYVEESIDEASQWVVFEPNSSQLWGAVKRNLVNFLSGLWRSGALFGDTPDEAFYVKVDEENNPAAERDAGRLNIEVGIAPVKPAEFVIIRISQKTLTA